MTYHQVVCVCVCVLMLQLQRQDPEFSGQPGVTNIIVDLYLNDGTSSMVCMLLIMNSLHIF